MEIPYIHGQLHDVIDYSKLIKLQASSTNDISKVVSYKKKFAKKEKTMNTSSVKVRKRNFI